MAQRPHAPAHDAPDESNFENTFIIVAGIRGQRNSLIVGILPGDAVPVAFGPVKERTRQEDSR
jgi:hypothetical protein